MLYEGTIWAFGMPNMLMDMDFHGIQQIVSGPQNKGTWMPRFACENGCPWNDKICKPAASWLFWPLAKVKLFHPWVTGVF